jgi:hypothetical protein
MIHPLFPTIDMALRADRRNGVRLANDCEAGFAYDDLFLEQNFYFERRLWKEEGNCSAGSRSRCGFEIYGNVFNVQRREHLEPPKEFVSISSKAGTIQLHRVCTVSLTEEQVIHCQNLKEFFAFRISSCLSCSPRPPRLRNGVWVIEGLMNHS